MDIKKGELIGEIVFLRGIIDDLKSRLAVRDADIARLQQKIARLKGQQS